MRNVRHNGTKCARIRRTTCIRPCYAKGRGQTSVLKLGPRISRVFSTSRSKSVEQVLTVLKVVSRMAENGASPEAVSSTRSISWLYRAHPPPTQSICVGTRHASDAPLTMFLITNFCTALSDTICMCIYIYINSGGFYGKDRRCKRHCMGHLGS